MNICALASVQLVTFHRVCGWSISVHLSGRPLAIKPAQHPRNPKRNLVLLYCAWFVFLLHSALQKKKIYYFFGVLFFNQEVSKSLWLFFFIFLILTYCINKTRVYLMCLSCCVMLNVLHTYPYVCVREKCEIVGIYFIFEECVFLRLFECNFLFHHSFYFVCFLPRIFFFLFLSRFIFLTWIVSALFLILCVCVCRAEIGRHNDLFRGLSTYSISEFFV